MSQYLIYTFTDTGTTITNSGTGGATYNGTATRVQTTKDTAGYPVWGPLNEPKDGITVAGGISNPFQHSWQIGLSINQWWPIGPIVNGFLTGNDGKLWSIGSDTAYGYIHGETTSGTPTGRHYFTVEIQGASSLDVQFWLGVGNNKPTKISPDPVGSEVSSLYQAFSSAELQLYTNYYFQISVNASASAANEYCIGNCLQIGSGCDDASNCGGFPAGCSIYSWREDDTVLDFSGGGNWADDQARWSGSGTPSGGGGTTPTTAYGGATPAAVAWPDGSYFVFVRGTTGAIYYKEHSLSTTGWGNWTSIGGTAPTGMGPGASSKGQGDISVFTPGTNQSVYETYTSNGSNWSAWATMGGTAASSCASTFDGTDTNVFVQGTDGACYWKRANSGWVSIGGSLLAGTGPAVCTTPGGNMIALATGTSGAVYYNSYSNGSWSGWFSIGGSTSASPAIAIRGSNDLAAFARGSNGSIYVNKYDGSSWGGWTEIGGLTATQTGPGVCVNPATQNYELFVTGTDGSVYQTEGNIEWANWANLGGSTTVSPTQPSGPSPNIVPTLLNVGIWIGIGGSKGGSYTGTIGTPLTVNGAAGYTDSNGNWIASRPYTGQLWEWATPSGGAPIDSGKITPAADGTFTFEVSDTTAEEVSYNVGIVASAAAEGGTSQQLIAPATGGSTTVTPGKTPCKVTLVTVTGCDYCQNLETMLNNAGIPYNNVDMGSSNNYGFSCAPGVVLCSGSKIGGCSGNNPAATDVQGLYDAIVTERQSLEATTTTITGGTAAVYSTTTGAIMPTQWATSPVVVTWQTGTAPTPITPTPTTPTATTPTPIASLTPVLPVPPKISEGITVVLRDPKKAPSPR